MSEYRLQLTTVQFYVKLMYYHIYIVKHGDYVVLINKNELWMQ